LIYKKKYLQESDTIRFRVTLEDSVPLGQHPNIVGVEAYVIILDENDNSPQFLGMPYETVVAEDALPGTTILPIIRLMDPDLLGDNIEVTCVSQPQVSCFVLLSSFFHYFYPVLKSCIL
jgi:hypothetical protein